MHWPNSSGELPYSPAVLDYHLPRSTAVVLLERDAILHELGQALAESVRGEGRLVVISGEAGIGKTALVGEFARGQSAYVPALWGACDELFTPRPLGPFHDIALQAGGVLDDLMRLGNADRTALFDAALEEFQRQPRIVIVEDIHWADEATLDLLCFLGRRIRRTGVLLVLTYRDDELIAEHPLRRVVGDLTASGACLRLALAPLSEQAVSDLVGSRPIDVRELHRRTGGNPFFVTEVLGSGRELPLTIRDAVFGRIARLPSTARSVLDVAAVIGPRIEPWLLERLAPEHPYAADECLAAGLFVAQGKLLAFRHELVRQAVLDAIPVLRRARLHRSVLDALRSSAGEEVDLARLVHHAEGADDCAALLVYAPAAAGQSARAGAHRAAEALFRAALPCAASAPPAERAALLEAHAVECQHVADAAGAIGSRRQLVALWRELGDQLQHGHALAGLASALYVAGERAEARQVAQEAIDLLECLPHGLELSYAYCTRSLLQQTAHDLTDAIASAHRAVALAEPTGSPRGVAQALTMLARAEIYLDYDAGHSHFERARSIATQAGLDSTLVNIFANLGSNSVELLHLDQAERTLDEGLAFCADRDFDRMRRYMLAWLAMAHLYRGRWAEAATAATEALRWPNTSSNSRWAALLALGRLAARQGSTGMPRQLDEALVLASKSGEIQLLGPVRAARAEAAWLAGDLDAARAEADAAYELAVQKHHAWATGELAFWRWRSGGAGSPPDWAAAPFLSQIAGDWPAAAAQWRELGCPFEEARALADGDVPARTQALVTFDALGAHTMAAELRRHMRGAGIRRVPRGPNTATRGELFGLTPRQAEVLALLVQDMSNSEIATRLSLTPKTVEHHVMAVLAKLDVHTRKAAVALARQRGFIRSG
jgi:predicted ATPase/DNA-binding CsgD family transcriptional regulator